MPRVSGGSVARNRRKKILKLAKGYYGSKSKLYRTANEQVMRSLAYSYRDRKQRKRDFRKLWIARINAAARAQGISYSRLTYGLKLANVEINRKMLSELAIHEPAAFTAIVEIAKKSIDTGVTTAPVKEVVASSTANTDYASMTVSELKAIAKEQGKQGISALKKAELIELLS